MTQPSHGEFRSQVWDLNGKLIKVEYLPDEGYTGPDSFTWKVTETDTAEEYESDPHATVTITVTEE